MIRVKSVTGFARKSVSTRHFEGHFEFLCKRSIVNRIHRIVEFAVFDRRILKSVRGGGHVNVLRLIEVIYLVIFVAGMTSVYVVHESPADVLLEKIVHAVNAAAVASARDYHIARIRDFYRERFVSVIGSAADRKTERVRRNCVMIGHDRKARSARLFDIALKLVRRRVHALLRGKRLVFGHIRDLNYRVFGNIAPAHGQPLHAVSLVIGDVKPVRGSALHGFRVLADAAVKPVRAPSDDKRIACVGADNVAVVLEIAHVDALCIADREIHFVGQAIPELFGEPHRAFGGIRRRYGYLRGIFLRSAFSGAGREHRRCGEHAQYKCEYLFHKSILLRGNIYHHNNFII